MIGHRSAGVARAARPWDRGGRWWAVGIGLACVLLAGAAARAPSSKADADPASDVLLAQGAFYPYQPPVAPALEAALERVLRESGRGGLELKVAIIGSREDLGAVPDFFGHPQQYADFLDREISFNHPQPLLVVMPAGYGVVNAGSPRPLAGIPIDTRSRSYGLTRTAILAVVALARADNVPVGNPSIPPERAAAGGPAALLLFGLPIALLILAGIASRPFRLRNRAHKERSAGARTGGAGPRVATAGAHGPRALGAQVALGAAGASGARAPTSARRAHARARARRTQIRRRRAGLLLTLAALAVLGLALASGGGHARSPTRAARGGATGGVAAFGPIRHTTAGAGQAGSPQLGSPESAEVKDLIAAGRPIYCAGHRGNEVALTFDDGPGPYTRLVINKLHKHRVHATFFVVGRNIPLVPGATRLERGLGAVGDHTFTHPLLTALAPAEAEAEIVRTQVALARSSGGPVFLFRPPYGGRDATIDAIARAHGLLEILWTVDSADSLGANYAQIEHNVISGMRPGAIILMHENHGQTVRALLNIFAALQRKHLRAVSVPQLLTDDPPSSQQLLQGGLGCGIPRGTSLAGGS